MSVIIENKLPEFINKLNNININDVIFEDVQQLCPVNTGHLKSTGYYNNQEIGYDCDYAIYAYYKSFEPQWIERAIAQNINKYIDMIIKEVES